MCKSIRNGAYTSYGVGGTQRNVVIILSIPFVTHLDLEVMRLQVLGLVNEAREKGVIALISGEPNFILSLISVIFKFL